MENCTNYEQLGKEIGILVDIKQSQYGDSFGKAGQVLRILYPEGVMPHQYDDVLAVARIVDKLFRIANGCQGGENPYQDIAGYGLLGLGRGKKDE